MEWATATASLLPPASIYQIYDTYNIKLKLMNKKLLILICVLILLKCTCSPQGIFGGKFIFTSEQIFVMAEIISGPIDWDLM